MFQMDNLPFSKLHLPALNFLNFRPKMAILDAELLFLNIFLPELRSQETFIVSQGFSDVPTLFDRALFD